MDYATSFGRVIPELVLTGSGLVLLMIAAFGGEKASRLVSILAAVALGAAAALTIPALRARARSTVRSAQTPIPLSPSC